MGSLILCHNKKAKHPYEVTRIRRKIYTIEELCYYLCNNLYLIDYTIMNSQLCDWVGEELEMENLAVKLSSSLERHNSVEHFVLLILNESQIYSSAEVSHIQSVLQHLKNQNEIERKKFKADNLQENGEIQAAIQIYHEIIHGETDHTVDQKFYGRVYGCMGAAFGKMFLYKEAADMYEEAYQICEEETMLKAYLYCCYRYMKLDDYQAMVKQNQIFEYTDKLLQEEMNKSIADMPISTGANQLEQWKKAYRRGE